MKLIKTTFTRTQAGRGRRWYLENEEVLNPYYNASDFKPVLVDDIRGFMEGLGGVEIVSRKGYKLTSINPSRTEKVIFELV